MATVERIATDTKLEAWKTLLQTHSRVVRTLEEEMDRDQGLPLTWYEILGHLRAAPESRLRMQTLAESILLSRSGLTRLFDRMEEAGLVLRAPCAEDRRGTWATLTEKGKEVYSKASPGHISGIQQHFSRHISDDDASAIIEAFSKILDVEGRGELECGDETTA
ncbi:MAG: MarR family transcriptional regulator [SAR202 cluster bacterium]|nr:MarR family transcriptional regulator [SAR202 cluster bacterium]